MTAKKDITDRLGGGENPFIVPEGYFEQSRARIMERIAMERPETPVRKINSKSRLVWISGIAASLLVGLILFQDLYLQPANELKLAREEIRWFINFAGTDLNSASLAYYAAEEGLSIDELTNGSNNSEMSSLLELTEFDEIYIIEEWMKSENKQK